MSTEPLPNALAGACKQGPALAAAAPAPAASEVRRSATAVLLTLNQASHPREEINLNDVRLVCEAVATPASAPPAAEPAHPDDAAVDQFAALLKAKLAKARAKGRSGWRDPSWSASDINRQMHEHTAKGDPLDVAAYAMFLALRGEATAAAEPVAAADKRKPCTCDGAGRGPGRECVVKAGGRLGELWRCAKGCEPLAAAAGVLDVLTRCIAGIDHLAELARQWEPDHSTGRERRGWVLAKDARDDAERLRAALAAASVQHVAFDLVAHLRRQMAFSARTFGPGDRTAGVCDRIRKELREVQDDAAAGVPTLPEWVDVILLALDGAWRSGASPEQIAEAVNAKQTRNEARVWPDWRTAEPGKAIEHDRSHDAAHAHKVSSVHPGDDNTEGRA